jgi:hypothetical protein
MSGFYDETGVTIMPKGPQGQKRPADAVANAVMVARIATGEIEADIPVPAGRNRSATSGGLARARNLDAAQRSEQARNAASVRWG